MAANHVTVGIVGGGIAGLTLAKMLERLNISYILWDAYEIAPPAGASIGLMPNGLRILDQLGIIDKVEAYSVPRDSWEHRDGDDGGRLYTSSYASGACDEKLGYGTFFMERRRLLEILYQSIEDVSRIHPFTRVVSVVNHDTGATVTTADNARTGCDFVAGADGVHSIVRREIEAATVDFEQMPNYLNSQCACVYGISASVPQIGPGRAFTIYRRDVSALVFSGLGGVLYWFLFKDLKSPIPYGQKQRYDEKDIEAVYSHVADTMITPGVQFSDIYRNKTTATMTVLEEGMANVWYSGRILLLGDSAHKMVPHAAMGANQAMESAACFVNNLRKILDSTDPQSRISISDAEACLERYAHRRKDRLQGSMQTATSACRNQLKISPESDAFLLRLPGITEEEWLSKSLAHLCRAEYLEDWSWNSDRVLFYIEEAERMWKEM